VTAGMHSQQSCMGSMMGMGASEGRRGRQGLADTSREELTQPLTEGRKKVGEQFTCPVDGRRMIVTEHTPATEYRGTTYYFCTQQDKEAFLKDPEQYAKQDVSRVKEEK
jgi:YHS domain-containing protein